MTALIAYGATGCVASDGEGGEDGLITAKWSFKELATGSTLGCPAGFNTTAVHVIPVDALGNRLGNGVIDLYNCSDMRGTEEYPPDRYEVYMEITTASNSGLYADTPSAIVDIIKEDATITQTIIDDGGYFYFDWALRGATTGAQLTCDTAMADGVEIISTLNGTSSAKTDIFNCRQGGGYTAGLRAGTYTLSIAALDTQDRSIGTVPALTNKTISAPNKTTDLGLVMIPIDGK
ncbi:MAG TPA: hypothetical protein VK427_09715 [Kofleriaceae bacterium]|nr:hypothetical protein [Kofleriaceae bacterium]